VAQSTVNSKQSLRSDRTSHGSPKTDSRSLNTDHCSLFTDKRLYLLAAWLLISVLALARFVETVHPRYDSGAYIIAAKSLAEGKGLTHLAHPESPPFTTYPPLIPLLLSPFAKFAQDGFNGLKAGIVLFFSLSVLVFALGFRERFGPRILPAMVLFGTGSVLAFAGRIQGEIPFLFLSLFVLIYAERYFKNLSRKNLAILLISLFLLANARQAGIAWSGGVLLALAFAPVGPVNRRRIIRKRVLAAVAIVVVVIVPWALLLDAIQPGAVSPGASSVLRADGWDPEKGRIGLASIAMLGRIKANLIATATLAPESLFFTYNLSSHAWMKIVFWPLFALMLAGFAKRLVRNRTALEGVTVSYCGLIFITPWLTEPRFFTVILPILLVYLYEGVTLSTRVFVKQQAPRIAGTAFTAICLVIALVNAGGVLLDDHVNPWSAKENPDYEIAQFAKPHLNENDIVLSHDHCAFYLLTGNHSLSFTPAEQKFHPVYKLHMYLLRGERVDAIAYEHSDAELIDELVAKQGWSLEKIAEDNRFSLKRVKR
jgi:hypothetical protein